jgi:hypothetical protein
MRLLVTGKAMLPVAGKAMLRAMPGSTKLLLPRRMLHEIKPEPPMNLKSMTRLRYECEG